MGTATTILEAVTDTIAFQVTIINAELDDVDVQAVVESVPAK